MRVRAGSVRTRLGLERRAQRRHGSAQPAHHRREHVILGEAHEALADLHRGVTVAEVVGDARERVGVVACAPP